MIIGNFNELEGDVVNSVEAKNASMKVLVSPKEGWQDHVMRVVELEKDGHSPKHMHDWPHINYVIEGDGKIQIGEDFYPLTAGSYAFVPNNTLHQFINVGDSPFKFICIVPTKGHL